MPKSSSQSGAIVARGEVEVRAQVPEVIVVGNGEVVFITYVVSELVSGAWGRCKREAFVISHFGTYIVKILLAGFHCFNSSSEMSSSSGVEHQIIGKYSWDDVERFHLENPGVGYDRKASHCPRASLCNAACAIPESAVSCRIVVGVGDVARVAVVGHDDVDWNA